MRLLLRLKPDMLVAAHFGPVPFAEENLKQALALLEQRERLLGELFPWDSPNFGLDPQWVRAYPFRQTALPGQQISIEARLFNHSASARPASVELRAPAGWGVENAQPVVIPPHTEGAIRVVAKAPTRPQEGRAVLGLAVHFDDKNLGESAVAIVDFLQ
jgi:hypothetical protein